MFSRIWDSRAYSFKNKLCMFNKCLRRILWIFLVQNRNKKL